MSKHKKRDHPSPFGAISQDLDRAIHREKSAVSRSKPKSSFNWLGKCYLVLVMVTMLLLGYGLWSEQELPIPDQETSRQSQATAEDLAKQVETSKAGIRLQETYQASPDDYVFKWTLEDYDKLVDDRTRLDEVVAAYGKPYRVELLAPNHLQVRYTEHGNKPFNTHQEAEVSLDFRQVSGQYVLFLKHFYGFPLPEGIALTPNPEGQPWTKQAVLDLEVGVTLNHVLKTYQVPDFAWVYLNGEGRQVIQLTYWTGSQQIFFDFTQDTDQIWRLNEKTAY